MRNLFISFCFLIKIQCFCQTPADFRDNFTGVYHVYDMWTHHDITVIRDSSTIDSLYVYDEMWGEGPYPDCPVNCYRHQVKLNSDSTWYKAGNYNGDFKRTDTMRLFFVAPGPFAYFYNAKKISPIGVADYQKSNVNFYLYPNPANTELTIIMPGETESMGLQLIDIYGKMVLEKTFKTTIRIDVRDLSKGIYMVRIKGSTIDLAKRVVLVN